MIEGERVEKYIHKMANFRIQKDVYKNTEEQRSKKESTRGQFPIMTSLFETSKAAFNIVEITHDSTLYSQKSSSNDLLNEDGVTPLPLSRTKCSKEIEAATGSEKNGPFSAIKENMLKKQKDAANSDEFTYTLSS